MRFYVFHNFLYFPVSLCYFSSVQFSSICVLFMFSSVSTCAWHVYIINCWWWCWLHFLYTHLICRLKARVAVFSIIVLTFLDSFRNKSSKPQPIRTTVSAHAQLKGRQRSRNFGHDRLSGTVGAKWGAQKCPRRRVFFVSNTRSLFGNFTTADFRQIWPWHVNRDWNADVKIAQFSDFGLFSHTKRLKGTFWWPAYDSPGVTSQNDSDFFYVIVEGQKGCLPAAEFSCDFW